MCHSIKSVKFTEKSLQILTDLSPYFLWTEIHGDYFIGKYTIHIIKGTL